MIALIFLFFMASDSYHFFYSNLSTLPLFFYFFSLCSVCVLCFSQLHTSVPEWRNVPGASALCLQAWLKWEGMQGKDGAHTCRIAWQWTHQWAHHWSHEWTQCSTPAANTSSSASRWLRLYPSIEEHGPDETNCQAIPTACTITVHPTTHPTPVSPMNAFSLYLKLVFIQWSSMPNLT